MINASAYLTNHRLLLAAANLLSDDGENTEYDRAIAELVRDAVSLPNADQTDIIGFVRSYGHLYA